MIKESLGNIMSNQDNSMEWHDMPFTNDLTKDDMFEIMDQCQHAKKHPMTDGKFIIKGFKIMFHWAPKLNAYRGIISCSPKSASTYGIFGNDEESLIRSIQKEINDNMRYYKNGGEHSCINDLTENDISKLSPINQTLSKLQGDREDALVYVPDKYRKGEFKQVPKNKLKGSVKLNEKQLRDMIKESIKKVLKESVEKTPIFGVHGVNITQDEGYEDYRITSGTYYSEDEAIEAAREAARSVADDEDVIEFRVMAGEYETPSGDVYGEPDAIYSISNKDEQTTIQARKQAGYLRLGADEYV